MTDLKDIEPVAWAITSNNQLLYHEGGVSKEDTENNLKRNWSDEFSAAQLYPFYSSAQVTELLAEREARIQELEGALKEATSCGDWEPHIMRPLSTTSPKAALEAYGRSKYAEGYEAAMSKGRTGVGISN